MPPRFTHDYDASLSVLASHYNKLAVFALVLFGGGCETAEQVEFGDPARVAGGFNDIPTDPAADCVVNNACSVSWSNRIYAGILDAPLASSEPTGACGAPACHDSGAGGLVFQSGNSADAFFRLTTFGLPSPPTEPPRPYVVPCHPELSHIMCNLLFEDGVVNPHVGDGQALTGGCGSVMPKPDEDVVTEPLNQEQLDDIAEWIACGAPQN